MPPEVSAAIVKYGIFLAADMTALHDVVLVKNQDYNEQRQLEEGI